MLHTRSAVGLARIADGSTRSLQRDGAQFGERAFQVIGFTCELLSSPSPELGGFKRAFNSRNRRFIDAWGKSCGSGSRRVATTETKNRHQPFHGCKKAAAGPLSKEFLQSVSSLFDEPDEPRSVLFLAGGSAAFDFIRVQVVRKASKKVRIALGDAKHKSVPPRKRAVVKDAKRLGKKARSWFMGMKRALKKVGIKTESKFAVSLITNVETPGYELEPVKCGNGVEVIILSPSNFHFPPWSDLLFRCMKSAEQPDQK